MSFGTDVFLLGSPSQPIAGNFPGITLFGQEPNGLVVDIREINGSYCVGRNAFFDQGLLQWTQANTLLPSSLFVLGPNGVIQNYAVAAGASSPINWGTPIFATT